VQLDRQLVDACERYLPPELPASEPDPAPLPDAPANVVEIPRRFALTEYGNAERFVARHGADVRFVHDWNRWLVWDGIRWKPDDTASVMRLAKETVRAIYAEASRVSDDALRKDTASWARRSETATGLTAMLRLAQSEPGVPVVPDQLDSDRWLLNVPNGTVDLRSGELRPNRRDDLLTKLAPVTFDPQATCPRWEKFLGEVFEPHPDIIPFIQRALGYSLTGDTREECLFLLHGTGRNGKGVLLRTVALKLGDYAGTADFSTFVARSNDAGPRDDVANLRGKRFVSAQESREGAALAESLIKWLTGGDLVRARRLYENSSEFDPTHKLWLASNHKPTIRGTDAAIWTRIKLIPFDVSFEGREDRTLKVVLEDELPGILAWAVRGCLDWQREGLVFPESVLKATGEYRAESDQTARFMAECCVIGDCAQAKARLLYAAYRRWAEEGGEAPATETAFGRRMAERGFAKEHTVNGSIYRGLGLRREEQ
jgi:putative DNA primase/helicase